MKGSSRPNEPVSKSGFQEFGGSLCWWTGLPYACLCPLWSSGGRYFPAWMSWKARGLGFAAGWEAAVCPGQLRIWEQEPALLVVPCLPGSWFPQFSQSLPGGSFGSWEQEALRCWGLVRGVRVPVSQGKEAIQTCREERIPIPPPHLLSPVPSSSSLFRNGIFPVGPVLAQSWDGLPFWKGVGSR